MAQESIDRDPKTIKLDFDNVGYIVHHLDFMLF